MREIRFPGCRPLITSLRTTIGSRSSLGDVTTDCVPSLARECCVCNMSMHPVPFLIQCPKKEEKKGSKTDHVRCAGSVRMARVGCGGAGVMGTRVVVGVAQVGFAGSVPLVDPQIDGHLALQTADVTVAKVVAQLVNLKRNNII